MRNIKFRGWDKNNKKMEYKDVGVVDGTVIFIGLENYRIANGVEAMQYTGIKDKNGKEIYEGDILCTETEDEKFYEYVEFHNGAFMLAGKDSNGVIRYDEIFCFDMIGIEFYVAGNIYENPELLDK